MTDLESENLKMIALGAGLKAPLVVFAKRDLSLGLILVKKKDEAWKISGLVD